MTFLSAGVKCLLSGSSLRETGEEMSLRLLLDQSVSFCSVGCTAIGCLYKNRGQWGKKFLFAPVLTGPLQNGEAQTQYEFRHTFSSPLQTPSDY